MSKPQKKFDPKKLAKLNDPKRLEVQDPELMRQWLGQGFSPNGILDIGAGTGFFSRRFAPWLSAGNLWALDIEPVMVQWMKENLAAKELNLIKPMLMGEQSIPLEDECAEMAVMINLHHELDRPAEMLAECLRCLKKGGKLLIIDWKKKPMDFGPPLEIRVETTEVESQLKEAGFIHCSTHDEMLFHFGLIGDKA